ncbi:FAD-dependent monooxygenase [Sphingomonas sp. HMP9]|uniref:FAD-dependent monooxygenase n=1 Tax=Sphingomonas sp. HMP9 TaxID=1517554 RepID=UPI001E39BB8E|nr:FAD-dependent monooxygenase [Sphingomonas sp. HMP9]
MSHHGVSYRIFERKRQGSTDSKGHNMIARSQELLDAIGVRDALAAQSYASTQTQIILDRVPLARLDTRDSGSRYEAVLFSGQDVIENVLADSLGDGNAVERGRPVLGIEADEDGVVVSVGHVDADGEKRSEATAERLRCRYLVGADGVRGTVRKAVGLDFSPTELEGTAIRQVDAKLEWRRSTDFDELWFFLYPDGFAGVMPVWEGVYRLFFMEADTDMPAREPTLDEMVARAREVIGDETFTMTDPVWFSYGKFKHGVAPDYARGRVYLVGDAGHTTLPIGGQGMNAGFHDAVGLGWRLAMTLADACGSSVLDSFAPERHGAHAALGEQQLKGFHQLMDRSRLADAAVKTVSGFIPNLASRVFGGSDLAQLELAYLDSPLSEDHFSKLNPKRHGAARAGDRAPDAAMTTVSGDAVTLHQEIYNPDGKSWGWRLLAFDGRDAGSRADLSRGIAAVAAWSWVRPLLVLANPRPADDGTEATRCLFDLDGLAHHSSR